MAINPIKILNDVLGTVVLTVTVSSISDLGGGSTLLLVDNTYYLNKLSVVTIDAVDYTVTDFVINESLTISGSPTPTASSFTVAQPAFFWGNPQMVSAEIVKMSEIKTLTYPYIWAVEISTTGKNLSPSAAVKAEKSFNLFFFDTVDRENWTIEDHYDQDIYPLSNYIEFFFAILKSRRDLFEADSITWNETNHVNFGDYISDEGMKEKILNDNITGIQVQAEIPFMAQDCQEMNIVANCPIVPVTFNGTPVTGVNPGNSKAVIVQTDDAIPVQTGDVILDDEGNLTIEVASVTPPTPDIWYNRARIIQTVSFADFDSAYRAANGGNDYFESIPQNAVLQEVLPDVPNGRIDYLKYFNEWGHKFRFTGLTGGYYDEADGLYYDVNGVLSDKATEFPFYAALRALIIDNLTGLMVNSDRLGSATWAVAMSDAPLRTDGGFSDWETVTVDEMHIFDRHDLDRNMSDAERPPFNMSQLTMQMGDTRQVTTTQNLRYNAQIGGFQNTINKTTSGGNRMYMRVHSITPVVQP